MDDIVKRAMAKWPAVPSVYGWLALDRRGRWLIKGEPIGNPLVAGFIGRNYGPDARGRWFFQNGPQRVFVTLAYTPLVYRYAEGALHSTTGRAAGALAGAWVDDTGQFVLDAAEGPGVLHDRDLEALLHDFAAPDGAPLRAAEAPARFGFVPSPQPDVAEEACT